MRAAPAILALAAMAAGCREGGDPPMLRLATLIDASTVVASPLLPAPEAAALDAIAEEPVFATDFEGDEALRLGWSRPGAWSGPRLESTPDGNRSWCTGRARAAAQVIVLPAEPARRYRFRRSLHTTDPAVDLLILERAVPLREPERLNAPADLQAFARDGQRPRGGALLLHRFPAARAEGRWLEDEVDVVTSRRTRSFALYFSSQRQIEVDSAARRSCVGDLAAVRLAPTRRQEVALLARSWAGAGEPSALGIVKRGQLLELPRIGAAESAADRNFAHRDALFAPTPTTLRFPLRVPAEGRLTLGYGLAVTAGPGERASFRVAVESEDGAITEVLSAWARQGVDTAEPWHEAEIDLAPWAGRSVHLVLTTKGRGKAPVPALWGSPIVDRPRRRGEPPNVIVIGIDTLRTDAVSSYGATRPTTPNLDRLAAEGVRFADAVSAAPWTVPSFASIFTGLLPSRHGAINTQTRLAGDLTTLAERLRDAGWRTHAVAYKPILYDVAFDQGFDEWLNVPRTDRTAKECAAHALDFLERHHDRRFFLFLHLDDAHQPMRAPPPFAGRFAAAGAFERFGVELPVDFAFWAFRCPTCRDGRELHPAYRELTRAVYDGAVSFVDDALGTVLAALGERDIYDETLIAVVSDHGETLWDHGSDFGHGHMGEEVLRAVMVLKPQRGSGLRPGTVVESTVRASDLAPTLLELAGLEAGAAPADSRSLVALARGRAPARETVVSENPNRLTIAVRRGRWKYVTRHGPETAPREELYDLASDPAGRANLAGEEPERLAELRAALLEHVLRSRGGAYLVALGDGSPHDWEIEIAAPGGEIRIQTLAGFAPPRGAGPRRTLAGATGDRLLTLAELAVSRAGPIAAVLRGDGVERARVAVPGFAALAGEAEIERLLARPGPALHLLSVPGGFVAELPATESAENIEQLRALGYLP